MLIGRAEVATTCISVLALEAVAGPKRHSAPSPQRNPEKLLLALEPRNAYAFVLSVQQYLAEMPGTFDSHTETLRKSLL
jgi:hypothetical protein